MVLRTIFLACSLIRCLRLRRVFLSFHLASGIDELGKIPVAVFWVMFGGSFFKDDLDGRTSLVVHELGHHRSSRRTDSDPSFA